MNTTAALAASVAMSACGLPVQDRACLSPDAGRSTRNSPPRIVGPTPADNNTTVTIGSSCAAPEFSLRIEDDDLADTLNHTWWVDAPPGYVADALHTELVGVAVQGGSEAIRVVAAPRAVLNALPVDGRPHGVEAFVTDGVFPSDGLDPRPGPTQGLVSERTDAGCQVVPDVAYRVSFLWLVTVQPCP